MGFVVAIDGPAGSGKGTITKLVGEKLGLINIDTGAMYRCVTLKALNEGIDITEIDKLEKMLEDISIELKRENDKQVVLLDGKDVSKEIRTTRIDEYAPKYSAIKCIRDKMTPLQRKMGEMRKYYYGRKRYWNSSISKCRCKNIFRCFSRGKGKKKV